MPAQPPCLATAHELCGHVTSLFPNALKLQNAIVGIVIVDGECRGLLSSLLRKAGVSSVTDAASLSDLKSTFDVLLVSNLLADEQHLTDVQLDQMISALKEGGRLLFRQDLDRHDIIMPQLTLHFEKHVNAKSSLCLDMFYIKPLLNSIAVHGNHKDLVWCLKRTARKPSADGFVTERDFLDKTQYQVEGIASYEFVFGEGFISPGGRAQNTAFLDQLRLTAGERMLDIGSGIGGSPLQVAREFGVTCVGVDLSTNMLNMAIDKAHAAKDPRVCNMVANVLEFDFPANSFDVIYSRDCIQHIDDKATLYKRFYTWLRPGGRLLTTGYTVGKGELSEKFNAYLKQRHYGLKNKDEYLEACQRAGFSHFSYTDLTPRFEEILREELAHTAANKAEFVKRFSLERFDQLQSGWEDKLKYIAADNHNWTQIYCVK